MSGSRRRFFQDAAIFGAGLLGMSKSLEAQAEKPMRMDPREANHSHPPATGAPMPMMTPDVADLPHEMDGSVKVFRLVAEPVKRKSRRSRTLTPGATTEVAPGRQSRCSRATACA